MTDQTPLTEAGRDLVEYGREYNDLDLTSRVLAIEAEARTEAEHDIARLQTLLEDMTQDYNAAAQARTEARDTAYINKPEGYREGWAAAMALVREHDVQARTETLVCPNCGSINDVPTFVHEPWCQVTSHLMQSCEEAKP